MVESPLLSSPIPWFFVECSLVMLESLVLLLDERALLSFKLAILYHFQSSKALIIQKFSNNIHQTASFPFFLTVPVHNLLMILFYSPGSRVFSVSPRAKGIIPKTVAPVQEMSDSEI